MLLRPDATYINQATKHAEEIFPRGVDWLNFASKLPGDSVFKNSVLEPAADIAGELSMAAFARADWQNWISTMQIGVFEVATRVGLPQLANNQPLNFAVSQIYNNISASLEAFRNLEHPEKAIPELLKNAGLQALSQLTGNAGMIGGVFMQVVQAALWAADVAAAIKSENLGKDVPLPPLQTEDPATDTWQVNRVFEVIRKSGSGGVVFPDGKIEAASNADYTSLFLPAYRSNQPWQVQHREKGVATQQGSPREARGPTGNLTYNFDPGDGSTFGFMPGTTTTLRVLQASYRFYYSVRGTPVDRYSLRCKGVDKPCYKRTSTFDGSKDCRQCVDAESVWPVKGLGWAYGGAPLNVTTPGENVGAFYPSTNKLLFNLLEMISTPGPLLYTVDTEKMLRYWRESFEMFWQFMESEWLRHRGYGWRGLISRLATLMTAFDDPSGEPQLGGRDPDMPLSLINSARDGSFTVPFSASLYKRIIEPFCLDLQRTQLHYLDTLEVAYIPPGAGGIYVGTKVRSNAMGDRFLAARKALLNDSKRVLVDLRRVTDPEYREHLIQAGVKVSPVNAKIRGPGLGSSILAPDIKPPRAPSRPKVAQGSPLAGAVRLGRVAPRTALGAAAADRTNRRRAVALGVAAGGAVLTTAVAVALDKRARTRKT